MKRKNKIVGSAIILGMVILLLVGGYFYSKPKAFEEKDLKDVFVETSAADIKEEKEARTMTVYINGEVKMPGVYSLKFGGRVEDLIKKAGGFTEEAETRKLNLAKKLKDEDCIIVDKKIQDVVGSAVLKGTTLVKTSNGGSSLGEEAKININTASKEELKKIPGVGDVTAQKILDFREKNGNFSSVDDLKKIDRVGEKMINKIRDKIDVN